MITQEQLREIGMLRSSITPEEDEEMSRRIMTPEGQEEARRLGRELAERAQNMEQPKLPPTPSAPETYQVTIRGNGGGLKVTS